MLAVLGFGLVTAATSAREKREAAAPAKERLISLIQNRRSQMTDLDKAVRDLRGQVAEAQGTFNQRDRAASEASKAQEMLAAQAGATGLVGAGVRVKLSDAEKIPADAQDAGAYRISDADLQLVVNSLWAAGAEAIALNGNRIVATTSIRAAGETVVINFRPLTPPYRVEAIGADLPQFNASEISRRMRRWHNLFGLGFSTRRADNLTIAPYLGRVGIDVATPVGAA